MLLTSLALVAVTSTMTENVALAASTSTVKTYTATMAQPHTPKGLNGGTDDYHCFLIDPKVNEDSLIVSSQFVPQDPLIVHHAIQPQFFNPGHLHYVNHA